MDPQFEKRVNHVAPAENGGGWRVSVVDLGTDEVTSDLFRAVLVCNGHYSIPAFAEVANLKEFRGKVPSCTVWGGRLSKRFCNMFSESSTGRWAELQLPCCPRKQGEFPENMLQNLFLHNL